MESVIEGKKIVVTGGCGFIGSHVVEALWERNRVIVIDDLSSGDEANISSFDVEFHRRSITEPLEELFAGANLVFHLAASVSVARSVEDPRHDAEVNISSTLNVLEAARRCGVSRVIYSSSAAVYGEPRALPISESHPLRAISPYGLSKLTGERYCSLYCSLYGLETVSLRYFNVYGPKQKADNPYSGVISIFVRNAIEGQVSTIYGDGKQTRDFVYVKDVVEANLLAASGGREILGHAFNVGTGMETSVNDLARFLGTEAVHGPPRPGDIRHSVADTRLAKEKLSFTARTPLQEGLARYMDWYRAHTAPSLRFGNLREGQPAEDTKKT